MNKKNPKVDLYFTKVKRWQKELEKLRKILLATDLDEELKWGVPCYTYPVESSGRSNHRTNLVTIGELKDSCVLSFFKGALLHDAACILEKPGENTQSARIIRFTNTREITKLEPVIKSYIAEAIEAEKAGLKVYFKKPGEFNIPEEFKNQIKKRPALKTAFDALTPGRQRAYLLYFSAPKQSKTRESRIEKYVRKILDGKGINE